MEKLKAFYEEHKRAVIATSIAVGGFALVQGIRVYNGTKIDDVDFISRKDGSSMIIVEQRNGKITKFHSIGEVVKP